MLLLLLLEKLCAIQFWPEVVQTPCAWGIAGGLGFDEDGRPARSKFKISGFKSSKLAVEKNGELLMVMDFVSRDV